MRGPRAYSGVHEEELTTQTLNSPSKNYITFQQDSNAFGIQAEVISLSNMSKSDKKNLLHRLRSELECTRKLMKRISSKKIDVDHCSRTSNVSSNVQNGPQVENVNSQGESSKLLYGEETKGESLILEACGEKMDIRSKSDMKQATMTTIDFHILKQCETLLEQLLSHQHGWIFDKPVDVVAYKAHDYYAVIKHPMDLGTIKNKLISNAYLSPFEFASDVRLTFSNAMTYNPPRNQVHKMADKLNKFFEARWKSIEKKLIAHCPQPLQEESQPPEDAKSTIQVPQFKRKKVTPVQDEPRFGKWVMEISERRKLANDLESVLAEMPIEIYSFLKQHCYNKENSNEDEIEIDIDSLDDAVLFSLQELLDKYLKKQKVDAEGEYCEAKMMNEPPKQGEHI